MAKEDALSFWLEQNRLMWSRMQTIMAIEAGVLIGWYELWTKEYYDLSFVLLLAGSVILVAISQLTERDAEYMDCCQAKAGDKIPRLGRKGRRTAICAPLWLCVGNISLAGYTLIVK